MPAIDYNSDYVRDAFVKLEARATAAETRAVFPTIALTSPIALPEGNAGATTAYVWTLSLTRNGSTAVIPYTWAVTGTGSNPANAADFGGTFPTGSGSFAADETTKTITVLVAGDTTVEPTETFTLTVLANVPLNALTSIGTITNDDTAVPTKPGPGLLASDNVGENKNITAPQTPTTGWSNSSFTYSPSTSTVTAFNTVAGPDGSTLDASTIRFYSPATNGYASVECATPANVPVSTVTASIWLRGKVGGEEVQFLLTGTTASPHGPNITTVPMTLTNTWAKYTVSGSVATAGGKVILQVAQKPNTILDNSFDAAWPNLVSS